MSDAKANRLSKEKSPYLLQHAYNPVDWWPWCDEVFEKAVKEDKPILLSIGYSTCHWCHVMERESFEDPEIADRLNRNFICIKVDREERPDLDGVYMTASHILNQSGGWPLNVFMTPDKKPFFVGTYFPKETKGTCPGLMDIIPRVGLLWRTEREKINETAESVAKGMLQAETFEPGDGIGPGALEAGAAILANNYDGKWGGFGKAPKFPTPHICMFMLRAAQRFDKPDYQSMALDTLLAIYRGGVYDQIGGGLHRYSTDERWLVPHFEKMLYDQAMFILACCDAVIATDSAELSEAIRRTADYVLRELTDEKGGFYAGEDADSEGVEGLFYIWDEKEVDGILGGDAELFRTAYGFRPEGNFEDEATGKLTGKNIPHLAVSINEYAAVLGKDEPQTEKLLSECRERLFAEREKRIRPHRDEKVLTDWNGLMIAALAKASRVLNEPKYLEAALKAATFIETDMLEKARLFHRYCDGEAAINGFFPDYAALAWGWLEIHETREDAESLARVMDICNLMLDFFHDKEKGGFFLPPADGEQLLVRQKEFYDHAIPSGNSIAAWVFTRLATMTHDPVFAENALDIYKAFTNPVTQHPPGYCLLLCAADIALSA